jgi:hypothetical protein
LCICHADCLRRGSLGGDVEDSCSNGSRCTSRYYKVVFSNYRTVQRGFHCIILYSTIQHSIVVGASTHTSNPATAILGPVPCQTCWKGRVRQECRSSKNIVRQAEYSPSKLTCDRQTALSRQVTRTRIHGMIMDETTTTWTC